MRKISLSIFEVGSNDGALREICDSARGNGERIYEKAAKLDEFCGLRSGRASLLFG